MDSLIPLIFMLFLVAVIGSVVRTTLDSKFRREEAVKCPPHDWKRVHPDKVHLKCTRCGMDYP